MSFFCIFEFILFYRSKRNMLSIVRYSKVCSKTFAHVRQHSRLYLDQMHGLKKAKFTELLPLKQLMAP